MNIFEFFLVAEAGAYEREETERTELPYLAGLLFSRPKKQNKSARLLSSVSIIFSRRGRLTVMSVSRC